MENPIPDVPPDRLWRRFEFLIDRASAHDEKASGDPIALACAATLRRDAACIALMLEEPNRSRQLFARAGHDLLELGLPTGASFIAISDVRTARSALAPFDDVILGARRQWAPTEARERRKYQRPMADMARGTPYQLLAIMQADLLTSEVEPSDLMDDEPIRLALSRNGGHPAGVTGLSIDSYIYTANWLAYNRAYDFELPAQIRVNFATLMAARAEQINSARKDAFHWRLFMRPAELLDLDTTILYFLALGAGRKYSQLLNLTDPHAPMAYAPLQAAKALRKSQDLPT